MLRLQHQQRRRDHDFLRRHAQRGRRQPGERRALDQAARQHLADQPAEARREPVERPGRDHEVARQYAGADVVQVQRTSLAGGASGVIVRLNNRTEGQFAMPSRIVVLGGAGDDRIDLSAPGGLQGAGLDGDRRVVGLLAVLVFVLERNGAGAADQDEIDHGAQLWANADFLGGVDFYSGGRGARAGGGNVMAESQAMDINRPEVHNAFDDHLIAALSARLRELEQDHGVRIVVLAANGKSFSRIILFSPIAHEDTHSPNVPDGKAHNAQLEAYAKQQRLNWIEDPSNQDTRYRRNAIRKKILPELEQMQEGAITNLARSAQWLAQAQTLLDELAKEDAKSIITNQHLKITALQTLKASDPARANNLLRYWLKQQQLGMPSNERLQAWWRDLETLRRDAKLEWSHDGVKIRAWRDMLQIERTNPNTHKANSATKQTTGEWIFVPIAQNSTQAGLPEQWLKSATIETRARSGGERLKIKPNTPSKSLKNLYQEAGVPPWQRQIPLLFINDELIAVEGLGVSITHLSTQGKRLWPEWVYSSKS